MSKTSRGPRQPWSAGEDATLRRAVGEHGPAAWERIATFLPGRSAGQCNARYLNYLHPDFNLGKFTCEEDLVIVEGYLRLGSKWAQIAKDLPGRTGHAVKNRWQTLGAKLLGAPEAAHPRAPPKPDLTWAAGAALPPHLDLNEDGLRLCALHHRGGSFSSDDASAESELGAFFASGASCGADALLQAVEAESEGLSTFDFSHPAYGLGIDLNDDGR